MAARDLDQHLRHGVWLTCHRPVVGALVAEKTRQSEFQNRWYPDGITPPSGTFGVYLSVELRIRQHKSAVDNQRPTGGIAFVLPEHSQRRGWLFHA